MTNCINLKNNISYNLNEIFYIDRCGRKQISHTIKELINNKKEIKGLYAFKNQKNKIFYIGISQSIICRIKQHFYSKYINQASLVFLMALEEYTNKIDKSYIGERKNFPFEDYRPQIQDQLIETTQIIIQPIEDNFELYYSEILYSCYYKPYWNTFETH